MVDFCSGSSLKVERTFNYKLVKSILFNDDISSNLISFKYENAEQILNDPSMIYYVFIVDNNIAGLCAFKDLKEMSNVVGNYGVDIGILKKYRGKVGYELGKMMLDIFNQTFVPNKIFALIKNENRASIYFTIRMGFKMLIKQNEYSILGT